jgi:hypothetical protein
MFHLYFSLWLEKLLPRLAPVSADDRKEKRTLLEERRIMAYKPGKSF